MKGTEELLQLWGCIGSRLALSYHWLRSASSVGADPSSRSSSFCSSGTSAFPLAASRALHTLLLSILGNVCVACITHHWCLCTMTTLRCCFYQYTCLFKFFFCLVGGGAQGGQAHRPINKAFCHLQAVVPVDGPLLLPGNYVPPSRRNHFPQFWRVSHWHTTRHLHEGTLIIKVWSLFCRRSQQFRVYLLPVV